MPFAIADAEEYISLWPITWPLVAVRTKYGSLALEVLRSKRASACVDDVRTPEKSCQCGTTCSVVEEIRKRQNANDADLLKRLEQIKQLRTRFPESGSGAV